ncbi:MAG: magnesium/cobalt transporter CorA [Chloroflexi bacterium]|nr:magnesium/cobalt transporter CorA [Chloroflexota bacterium]OJV99766.1 MAG: magnesium and cobalt transport protein CorA [Chloroflexi bacterium 54-19]
MITPVYFCKRTHEFGHVENLDEVSDLLEDKDNLIWIDMNKPTPDELNKIGEEFGFHPLALEDASGQHQRPKVDVYENFYFVVFYSISYEREGNHFQATEIDMFMGENFLVTVHYSDVPALKEAKKRWQSNATEINRDIGVLLYSLLDTLVDECFPVLDTIIDEVEELEELIFEDGRSRRQNYTQNILTVKRNLINLRRVVAPERDLLNVITRHDSPIFSEKTNIYFQDVYDHLVRVTDTVDSYRDLLSGALDANLAVISNDLNLVMRTLTAFSIILMTDALIAGIYGMNFSTMPELTWQYGYPYCIILMAVVSGLIWFYFKRKKWF